MKNIEEISFSNHDDFRNMSDKSRVGNFLSVDSTSSVMFNL